MVGGGHLHQRDPPLALASAAFKFDSWCNGHTTNKSHEKANEVAEKHRDLEKREGHT